MNRKISGKLSHRLMDSHRNLAVAVILLVLNTVLTSCSSIPMFQSADEKWGKTYSKEEKIALSYKRGLTSWANGKKFTDKVQVDKAIQDFTILSENFDHKDSKDRLIEIQKYHDDFLKDNLDDIAAAKKKNYLLTMAGSYTRILKLLPDNAEALAFLEENKEEISKRIKSTLDAANAQLKSKEMTKAQKNFRSVLAVEPTNETALKGLRESNKTEKQPVVKNETDKEELYKKGLDAFESKDFVKAQKFFNSINDSAYKDTSLYIDRTQSKIEALDLMGGD